MFWYQSQLVCVKWDKIASNFYHISNGVRQGRILSPKSFALYMNKHKGKKSKDSHVTDILNAVKIIDQKFSGKPLPVEYYALRLVKLPNFTVDHIVDRMQKVEDVLQDILMSRQPADRTNPRGDAI